MLGLHRYVWAFSGCGELGLLSGCGIWAHHCGCFSCCGAQAQRHVGFSSCGTRAWLPYGMWNLPGPGIEPVSPALAGRFLTTGPPGKSCPWLLMAVILKTIWKDGCWGRMGPFWCVQSHISLVDITRHQWPYVVSLTLAMDFDLNYPMLLLWGTVQGFGLATWEHVAYCTCFSAHKHTSLYFSISHESIPCYREVSTLQEVNWSISEELRKRIS